jgi:RNA polymerase primary sigma factor
MSWHDDKIAELAKQLAYSPEIKRREQLAASQALLREVDPTRVYPWEFVLYRITGYRPPHPVEHKLSGLGLRADLSRLIEAISETLSIGADQLGEPVLQLEQVSQRFGVSSKTIQRWRRAGLAAQKLIFSDGRRKLGFLLQDVERFAVEQAQRVENAANFRQLTPREKEIIIRRASRMAERKRCRVRDICTRIATRLGRSPEAVRYTIRNYNMEHPDHPVIAPTADPIRDDLRTQVLALYEQGLDESVIAQQVGSTPREVHTLIVQDRRRHLRSEPIEYVPNALYELPNAEEIVLRDLPAQAQQEARMRVLASAREMAEDTLVTRIPRDVPAALREIFAIPPLPPELEADAFRQLNYLKYRARLLQLQLDESAASEARWQEILRLLDRVRGLKNQLVEANLRVVVHVARRNLRPGDNLLELVSDGAMWLMRAVDRFDFARGVKFSTYASYAITKNFARDRSDQIARSDYHLITGQEEYLAGVNKGDDIAVTDQVHSMLENADLHRALAAMLPRDRELLEAHFGLGATSAALSLAEIGAKMGITKARVKQLEERALERLRAIMQAQRKIA